MSSPTSHTRALDLSLRIFMSPKLGHTVNLCLRRREVTQRHKHMNTNTHLQTHTVRVNMLYEVENVVREDGDAPPGSVCVCVVCVHPAALCVELMRVTSTCLYGSFLLWTCWFLEIISVWEPADQIPSDAPRTFPRWPLISTPQFSLVVLLC